MGRGGLPYLSYTAFVLLSATSTASADLWSVNIDESPAPLPKVGPPFSAHASRNLALLPYQIIGIVGAYVGSCLIIGTLLLTVGRSLRKRAQSWASQPKEMVRPMPKAFDASPVSPASTRSWYSRRLKPKKSASSSIRSGMSPMSPGMDSVVSFDNTVIEADRARRQEEMERLYAAVLAQDERKASQQNLGPADTGAPPEYQGRNPPRLITDAPSLRHLQAPSSVSGPVSPSTPKSPYRAIYPPASSIAPGPVSPTSPLKAEYTNYSFPQQPSTTPPIDIGSGPAPSKPPTTNKLRKSLRNIKISSPIVKDDNSDDARTPLSPRFYTNPGIPPEPPTSRTTGTQDSYAPTTPGTARSWRYGDDRSPDEEQLDEVRDLPQPTPQRLSTYKYGSQAQMVTNTASTRPDPTKSGVNGSGTLPLREMNRQYAQQQSAQAAFPLSPGHWNAAPGSAGGGYITSAGPVKTTFLETRSDKLGAPRTGMATPYSPYMPFTPLTPVTPHLTSRAERKQREKEEKAIRGAITEEDAVADDKDLWSSGY